LRFFGGVSGGGVYLEEDGMDKDLLRQIVHQSDNLHDNYCVLNHSNRNAASLIGLEIIKRW
jgi:hypothetical protein